MGVGGRLGLIFWKAGIPPAQRRSDSDKGRWPGDPVLSLIFLFYHQRFVIKSGRHVRNKEASWWHLLRLLLCAVPASRVPGKMKISFCN